MNRRSFVTGATAGLGIASAGSARLQPSLADNQRLADIKQPLAITMWDFSWLERRWPGAGYENWDRVLDELVERG